MKYMGSKSRIADEILSVMLPYRQPNQVWVEPFVGGANVIDKVSGDRLGFDINPYLTSLLRLVRNGWIPPTDISEQDYNDVKNNISTYDLYYAGFVGFCCSYSGKWWGGYARGNKPDGTPRNYAEEASKNLLKQAPNLQGAYFHCRDYQDMGYWVTDEQKVFIYCDPPYAETTNYKNKFNHDEFWKWAELQKLKGHTVFVSEYNAPSKWECVWQRRINSSLTKNTGSKQGIERLFTI